MSWASRRRGIYLLGIISFLIVVIGIPLAKYSYSPPTCADGKQNQGETATDKGGPCATLDERTLAPSSVLWSRSFKVRDGFYSSVAYIENPNENAGVRRATYHFGLYDSQNILIAEREGEAFIMPGGITPIFEGNISVGNKEVAHTYFEFTEPPMWERLSNPAKGISITNKESNDIRTAPRVEATAENTTASPISGIWLIAVIFSPSGNAQAASKTHLPALSAGDKQKIAFTWPNPFIVPVGRIDIIPLVQPTPGKVK